MYTHKYVYCIFFSDKHLMHYSSVLLKTQIKPSDKECFTAVMTL